MNFYKMKKKIVFLEKNFRKFNNQKKKFLKISLSKIIFRKFLKIKKLSKKKKRWIFINNKKIIIIIKKNIDY